VATEFARTPELVEIANVKNLCALEVSTTSPAQTSLGNDVPVAALSDRIVRTWSELAQTCGAFRHLRVLRLYGQQSLTEVVFDYFRLFPSLSVIVAGDCGKLVTESAKDLAVAYRWEIVNKRRRKRRDGESKEFDELETAHKCYRASVEDDKRMKAISLDPELPILDCQIGSRYVKSRRSKTTVFLQGHLDSDMASLALHKRKRPGLIEYDLAEGRTKVRKPVLKNVPGKDLTGLLAEFS
jgi:hypothetical protein